jgi:precorrin isomerase
VIVTDAQCVVPARSAERFREWKSASKVRATALVIGSAPGALAELCEEVHRVPALDPAAEAVGRVLAL